MPFVAGGQTFTVTPTFDLAARMEEILGGVGCAVLLQQAGAGIWRASRVGLCVAECLMASDSPPTDRKTAERLVLVTGVSRFLFDDENADEMGPLLQVVSLLTFGPAALLPDSGNGEKPNEKKPTAPK